MTISNGILLFFAAFAAGVLNSVAGGGSFFSFPALIFAGVPPIPANATSTVALWPGTVASTGAYRNKIPHSMRMLTPLLIASVAGGFFGAKLLLHTPQRTFMRLIPFLFLAATLLFAFGKKLFRGARPATEASQPSWPVVCGVTAIQFCVAIYGGFFGGGMGILMLAFLSLLPLGDIHATNGVKTLLVSATNGVALVTFVLARIVFWPQAILMLAGAALGGYGGAHYAQRLNPARVRTFVVFVGLTMSFYFLWRYH